MAKATQCRRYAKRKYATLSMSYEEEQRELKTALPDMENYLETETDKTENLQRFIDKVKRITEIKELTAELVHEFIDKIVVHAPRYLDGKRVQLIDIYCNGVGILRELTPEKWKKRSKTIWRNAKQKWHSQWLHRSMKLIIQFRYKSHLWAPSLRRVRGFLSDTVPFRGCPRFRIRTGGVRVSCQQQ